MDQETAAVDETRGLSQWERLVDVFVAPATTFRDILRSTSWWLPFLLTVVATVGVTVAIQKKVGWDRVVQTQVQLSPSMQSQLGSLPPDQLAQRMHMIQLSYQYASYASPLIVLVISALAALILWATFNFGLGAKTTYGQIFCLWMYASLPRLLASLVTVIMLCFGGSPEGFNLKEPVGTNLAYYLPDAAPWLKALLSFGDVIGIWVLVLLVVGGAIIAKRSKAQVAAVVVGWWLLIVLVSVAATAAFS